MPLVVVDDSWDKGGMTIPQKPGRTQAAPALYRLLSESALSRAALGCCGVALALLDANAKNRPFTFVNAAFEALFGFREADALGRPLSALLFHNDEALVERLVTISSRRWELSAWGKDGDARHVEVSVAALRDAAGRVSHHVIVFSDRSELERLRSEVESLRSLAAASLGLRLERVPEPACGAQQPGIEAPTADQLYADRQATRILEKR